MATKIFASVAPLEKFAWPGGYPLFYMIEESRYQGGSIQCACVACANRRRAESIRESDPYYRIGQVKADVNWEDPELFATTVPRRRRSSLALVVGRLLDRRAYRQRVRLSIMPG